MAHRITPKCTNCDACRPICPTESIFYGSGHYVIDADSCTDCRVCVSVCPEAAIRPVQTETKPAPSKSK